MSNHINPHPQCTNGTNLNKKISNNILRIEFSLLLNTEKGEKNQTNPPIKEEKARVKYIYIDVEQYTTVLLLGRVLP